MISWKTFGQHPYGERLQRLWTSPNYKNGYFQNLHHTPMFDKVSTTWIVVSFILTTFQKNLVPAYVPFVKNDLQNANFEAPKITWFGHSSYLIQYKGKNILVDPLFCGFASPFSFLVRSFVGANNYNVSDLPPIDLLIITHDHYDHLDYYTISALKNKIKCVVTALGVGAHLESWGIDPKIIHELDWWDQRDLPSEIRITATPARHSSGRMFRIQKTFWASFMLELDHYKLFIGGDSGYDDQFKKIGDNFGEIDLAFLECGQYGKAWPFIHMFPEQTAQAAKDLNAKVLFPVHWGKFALARHAWDESIERLLVKAAELDLKVTTPVIGEPVHLGRELPRTAWWRT